MTGARFSLGLFLFAAACAGDDTLPPPDDGLPPAPPPGEWIEVVPGGDTICSRGTEFRFFVRGGRPDRVIIDFQGGGACWNYGTCSISDALFSDAAPTFENWLAAIESGVIDGIFDGREGAPFADWTIVHVPYCTGDIHWGNATKDYGMGLVIEHRGFTNATAALDYTYSRYPTPANVFVTGCSAGAYGAVLHSAYIADHYRDASVALLADSGAGIITDSFLNDSLPNWNAEPAIPPFIESLQVPISELTLPDLYVGIASYFPQHRFAQTATAYDADQIFYYEAMGGMPEDWPMLYRDSLATIAASAPNFRSYVPPGSMHCVTPYDFFDTRTVDGVALSTWSVELATGAEAPASVGCEGAECCDDPVCDGCAGSTDGYCRFCENWPPPWSECAM